MWQEYFNGVPTYRFLEDTYTDADFIYLQDRVRRILLRLPKKGGWSESRSNNGSNNFPWTSGYLVTPVHNCPGNDYLCFVHAQGRFQHLGRMWQEIFDNNPVYVFLENRQDENYIYLFDLSRNLFLALPKLGGWSQSQVSGGGVWTNGYQVYPCPTVLAQPPNATSAQTMPTPQAVPPATSGPSDNCGLVPCVSVHQDQAPGVCHASDIGPAWYVENFHPQKTAHVVVKITTKTFIPSTTTSRTENRTLSPKSKQFLGCTSHTATQGTSTESYSYQLSSSTLSAP